MPSPNRIGRPRKTDLREVDASGNWRIGGLLRLGAEEWA